MLYPMTRHLCHLPYDHYLAVWLGRDPVWRVENDVDIRIETFVQGPIGIDPGQIRVENILVRGPISCDNQLPVALPRHSEDCRHVVAIKSDCVRSRSRVERSIDAPV